MERNGIIHNNIVHLNTYRYQKYAKVSGLDVRSDSLPVLTLKKRNVRREMIKGYMKLLSSQRNMTKHVDI